MVTTVMTAPSVVWTELNICFRTITRNVVQPYRSVSRINVSKRHSVVPVCNDDPICSSVRTDLSNELDTKHEIHHNVLLANRI